MSNVTIAVVAREQIKAQRLEYQARLAELQQEYDRLLLELDKAERSMERLKGGIAALNAMLLLAEKNAGPAATVNGVPSLSVSSVMTDCPTGSSCTQWDNPRWQSTPTVNVTNVALSEMQKEALFAEFEQRLVHGCSV